MRTRFSAIAMFLVVIFSSCAGTGEISVDHNCIEGTLYVIGNEPFTHLAIEADSICASGELASVVKQKEMYILSGKEDVIYALYKYQGRKTRIFFKKMRVSADGNSILVTGYEPLK
ncbi:MAG: hypothetical protein ACP5US_06685 [Candidatus Kryptoniota bacterium]